MNFSLQAIAKEIDAQLVGSEDIKINGVASLLSAGKGDVSVLKSVKYKDDFYRSQASCIIVSEKMKLETDLFFSILKVSNPELAWLKVLKLFANQHLQDKKGIHKTIQIDPSVEINKDVYIGQNVYIGKRVKIGAGVKIFPFVYIGDDVRIDSNTIIYPHVTIYHGCSIGSKVIIHAGAVIGSDGFGYYKTKERRYKKIEQVGCVVLEDNVEIGANVTIDRATMDATIIKKGSKIDNLVQIAHNVQIGEHSVLASLSGIAGSTHLGAHSVLGGQVGIAGHIAIAEGSQFQAKSGITASIDVKNKNWAGYPLQAFISHQKSMIVYKKLPELEKKILALEKQILIQKNDPIK